MSENEIASCEVAEANASSKKKRVLTPEQKANKTAKERERVARIKAAKHAEANAAPVVRSAADLTDEQLDRARIDNPFDPVLALETEPSSHSPRFDTEPVIIEPEAVAAPAVEHRTRSQVQITTLPVGSWFTLGGRFGQYLGEVGGDVKVCLDGKNTVWSSASMVTPESAPAAAPATTAAAAPATVGERIVRAAAHKRNGWCGHAVTSVVKWLGTQGLGFDAVVECLKRVGVLGSISLGTIKAQLGVVKRQQYERYGQPANVTPEQAKQLMGN